MSNIEEIGDIDQLAGRKLLWRSLLGQTRGASFFQSLDWLSVYWRHFGRGQKLRVLLVSSGDAVVGILPLVVRSENTTFGRVRVLTYPLDNWGNFYGPIGSNPTATLMAGLGHIRRTRRDWDVIDLRPVDRQRVDRGRTASALSWHGLRSHRADWRNVALVETSGSWRDYWAGRDETFRNACHRGERQLATKGRLRHIRYRPAGSACGDDDPRWDLNRECESMALRSDDASSPKCQDSSDQTIQAFSRDVHQSAVRAGALDLSLLTLDDHPIAFAGGYRFGSSICGLRSGFDPTTVSESAESVLMLRLLRDSFERAEDRMIDFAPGSASLQLPWATSVISSYRYCHYPSTAFRAQALRLERWINRSRGSAGLRETSSRSAAS